MKEEQKKDLKQKLTLGISKDVIDKAKMAGINISSITEQVLKALTFDTKMNTEFDLIKAYDVFFEVIKPVLKKYGTSVKVGEMYEGDPNTGIWLFTIDLGQNGLSKNNAEIEIYQTVKVPDVVSSLLNPARILENLLKSLIGAAEKNKEKMKEFEIALRIIDALTKERPNSQKLKKKKTVDGRR